MMRCAISLIRNLFQVYLKKRCGSLTTASLARGSVEVQATVLDKLGLEKGQTFKGQIECRTVLMNLFRKIALRIAID